MKPTLQSKENQIRADRAYTAIEAYAGEELPDESHLRDLLTDLMHYSDRNKLDFDAELYMAKNNHRAEIRL